MQTEDIIVVTRGLIDDIKIEIKERIILENEEIINFAQNLIKNESKEEIIAKITKIKKNKYNSVLLKKEEEVLYHGLSLRSCSITIKTRAMIDQLEFFLLTIKNKLNESPESTEIVKELVSLKREFKEIKGFRNALLFFKY